MIGRYIFLCDTEHLIVAGKAVKYMHQHPAAKDVLISQGDGEREVMMFAKRLKGSISVRQVKP